MFVAQLWDFHPRLMDVDGVAASEQFGVPGVAPVLRRLYNLGATLADFSSPCRRNWLVIDAWVGHWGSHRTITQMQPL